MSDNQTFKNRLLTFIGYMNLSIRKFEACCGFPNGTVTHVKKSFSLEKKIAISNAFPQLNIDWLYTGEGEMIKDKVVCEEHVPYSTKPSTSTFSYGDVKNVLDELKTIKQKMDIYEGKIENYERERTTLLENISKLTSIISKLTEKIDNDNKK